MAVRRNIRISPLNILSIIDVVGYYLLPLRLLAIGYVPR
jgi:hypothetical protein